MDITDSFPRLSEQDIQIFRLFCEEAVENGDLLAPVNTQIVRENHEIGDLESNEFGKSVIVLMELGYMHRSGRLQYTITPTGFECYAKAYIENYDEKENAVKHAIAAVEQTNTNALVTSTGEDRYLVNHVLRVLQNRRDIGAFVGTLDSVQVTQVSRAFKQEQAARELSSQA